MDSDGIGKEPGHEVKAGDPGGQNGLTIPDKKWTLKTDIKQAGCHGDDGLVGYCTDVAVYADGSIVIADTEGNRLVTLGPEGQFIRVHPSNDRPGCVDNPTGVAIDKDDQLLVLDDNISLKFLNRDEKLVRQFTPFAESGGVPSCIAVDGDGQTAIGDEENEIISIFTSDGSAVKTIQAPMIGDYLTIDSKNNLLYTNFSEKKLLSLDYHGNPVISMDTVGEDGKPIHPSGVCCDSAGDIYVSAQSSPEIECGEIHHYDPEGRYKGRVIQGLCNPFGVIFTPSGDLVVADGVSVKIFHFA
ncbi:protein lin-41-like [Patiria miniata]|uniref:SMP-30/Gluconolactonase/LRE-like region domain-containing protein n=1 Tax=Patiria miniata TaxID=46514 RepID=A0A913ZJP4_PATMI|nr:protein lin-41-like [Patiria miniata]